MALTPYHQIVVVPSAMSGETNRLLGLAKKSSAQPDPRELDMLASTGEQAGSPAGDGAEAIGKQAVSYAGWQVAIKTDSAHTKARIRSIDDTKVRQDLNAKQSRDHPPVSRASTRRQHHDPGARRFGYFGSSGSGCAAGSGMLIYTDVDGVHYRPAWSPDARRLNTVT